MFFFSNSVREDVITCSYEIIQHVPNLLINGEHYFPAGSIDNVSVRQLKIKAMRNLCSKQYKCLVCAPPTTY